MLLHLAYIYKVNAIQHTKLYFGFLPLFIYLFWGRYGGLVHHWWIFIGYKDFADNLKLEAIDLTKGLVNIPTLMMMIVTAYTRTSLLLLYHLQTGRNPLVFLFLVLFLPVH